jgi:hypothetical protein
MRGTLFAALIIAVLLAETGCRKGGDMGTAPEKDSAVLEARMDRLTRALADSGAAEDKPIARWLLPHELKEISGLALTADGRLFAENDETARITEIDYRRGVITKEFFVGEKTLHGDFEGITCVGDRFFLMSSNGKLYEFREGAEGEHVDYTEYDTHLGKECEFEGVTYDSTTGAIILACKNVHMKKLGGEMVLYRYRPDHPGGELSDITIPYAEAIGNNDWKELRPTDITVDPFTGNFVLVAGQEKALVTLTPDGAVVQSRPLGGKHPQCEGIAITRDHILILSDESTKAAATITLYRWR